MAGETIVIRGVLGTGIECRSLTADSGETFSLVGALGGVSDGDRVQVIGTLAEFSFCMSGRTIAVQTIEAATEPAITAADGSRLVGSVRDVRITSFFSNPAKYLIVAVGEVGSLGWSNPTLRPLFDEEPADGVFRFAFEATPPADAAGAAMQPIVATWGPGLLHSRTTRLTAIVIHSATSSVAWPQSENRGQTRGNLFALETNDPDRPSPLAARSEIDFPPAVPSSPAIPPFPWPKAGVPKVPLPIPEIIARTATASSPNSFEEATLAAIERLSTGPGDFVRARVIGSECSAGGFVGIPQFTVTVGRMA